MAVTPKGIVTPDLNSPFNLVSDLNTLASTTDAAIGDYANVLKGTASARAAATSSTAAGILWQDTDGIKMIWRKDGSVWVPAVSRWVGTESQRNSFNTAPVGFEWFDTTNNRNYLRKGGQWRAEAVIASGTVSMSGGANVTRTANITFPSGTFSSIPAITTTARTENPQNVVGIGAINATTSGFTLTFRYTTSSAITVNWIAVQS